MIILIAHLLRVSPGCSVSSAAKIQDTIRPLLLPRKTYHLIERTYPTKMAFRTPFFVLLITAMAHAFVPTARPAFATCKTQLEFGFLKELGLEKPSWLPDFGGKKDEKEEEKTETPAAVTDGDDTTTTDDAPKEE